MHTPPVHTQWREQYDNSLATFHWRELWEIVSTQLRLLTNAQFPFTALALEEVRSCFPSSFCFLFE